MKFLVRKIRSFFKRQPPPHYTVDDLFDLKLTPKTSLPPKGRFNRRKLRSGSTLNRARQWIYSPPSPVFQPTIRYFQNIMEKINRWHWHGRLFSIAQPTSFRLGVFLFLLLFALLEFTFVNLALWQHSRMEEKKALKQHILEAQKVTVDENHLLPKNAWQRVKISGSFRNDKTFYLENQRHKLHTGRRLLTTLRLEDGRDVIIDRGWLPRPDKGNWPALSTFHAGGIITIEGLMRPLPTPPEGWLRGPTYSTETTTLMKITSSVFEAGQPVLDVYVQSLTPTHPDVEALTDPLPNSNKHKEYMLTWAALATLLPLMVLGWLIHIRVVIPPARAIKQMIERSWKAFSKLFG